MRPGFYLLFMAGILAGCSSVPPQAANHLDLTAYRIEQAPAVKVKRPQGEPYDAEQQNYLVFENSDIRIPLVRSAGDGTDERYGFDPATLKLRWLKQDELLLVTWTTFYHGSGGYTYDGNVILHIRGNRARELFRDSFESIAKAGWAAQSFVSLDIAYDDGSRTFRFTRSDIEVNGDTKAPDPQHAYPFTEIFTNDDGQVNWRSEVKTVDAWDYKLEHDKLKFVCGWHSVDLGDESRPIADIVKCFNVTRERIDSLNPDLPGRDSTIGPVLLGDACGPYMVSSETD